MKNNGTTLTAEEMKGRNVWLTCPDCLIDFLFTNPNPKKVKNSEYYCVRCNILHNPTQDVKLYDQRVIGERD